MIKGKTNSTTPFDNSQDSSPQNSSHTKQDERHKGIELSLETLQVLLTSPPDEESHHSDDELLTVAQERQSCLDLLTHTWHNKQQHLQRINDLKHKARGADWLNKNLSIFQSKFPWELVSLIENMALNNSSQVIINTVSDIPNNPISEEYHETLIGDIQGLEIFRHNIRRLITNNLEAPLTRLTPGILNKINDDELIQWSDWCTSLEQKFTQVEAVLIAGQRFFSERNFRLMEQLPLSPKSRSALQQINNHLFQSSSFN